jgi:uncharacterized damage-inducible protein DinB
MFHSEGAFFYNSRLKAMMVQSSIVMTTGVTDDCRRIMIAKPLGRKEMLHYFKMFAHYNRWANATLYAEAATLTREEFNRPTGAFFGSLMATLNHLVVADRIWLNRFTGSGPTPRHLDEILFEDFEPLREARAMEDARIIGWNGSLTAADLDTDFTYVPMTSPQAVTQKLGPALAHFFNHQTHHRGQAHMILTTLGKPSLSLDLIYYQRTSEGKSLL